MKLTSLLYYLYWIWFKDEPQGAQVYRYLYQFFVLIGRGVASGGKVSVSCHGLINLGSRYDVNIGRSDGELSLEWFHQFTHAKKRLSWAKPQTIESMFGIFWRTFVWQHDYDVKKHSLNQWNGRVWVQRQTYFSVTLKNVSKSIEGLSGRSY